MNKNDRFRPEKFTKIYRKSEKVWPKMLPKAQIGILTVFERWSFKVKNDIFAYLKYCTGRKLN